MFFPIKDSIIGPNAPNSDCFYVESAFAYLQQVKQSDFLDASGQSTLKNSAGSTTWIYFARKDNDDLHKADGRLAKQEHKQEIRAHLPPLFHLFASCITKFGFNKPPSTR